MTRAIIYLLTILKTDYNQAINDFQLILILKLTLEEEKVHGFDSVFIVGGQMAKATVKRTAYWVFRYKVASAFSTMGKTSVNKVQNSGLMHTFGDHDARELDKYERKNRRTTLSW